MRTFRTFFLFAGFFGLLLLNIAANMQDANATNKLYSAGNKMVNSQGQVMGCSCPVLAGDCVYELDMPDPGPAFPGI